MDKGGGQVDFVERPMLLKKSIEVFVSVLLLF